MAIENMDSGRFEEYNLDDEILTDEELGRIMASISDEDLGRIWASIETIDEEEAEILATIPVEVLEEDRRLMLEAMKMHAGDRKRRVAEMIVLYSDDEGE